MLLADRNKIVYFLFRSLLLKSKVLKHYDPGLLLTFSGFFYFIDLLEFCVDFQLIL